MRIVLALVLVVASLSFAGCRSDGDKSSATAKSAPDLGERAAPMDRSASAGAPAERPEPPPRPEPPAPRETGGGGHGW